MESVRILLADDEERMRKLVSDFLKKEGYHIFEAEDGKKALDAYRNQGKFDLIILDVMMPGLDGWSVCNEIRKSSRIPIIMLTAKAQEADELFGFQLGADEYIIKPFSPRILVARVQALLNRTAAPKNGKKSYKGLEIDESGYGVTVDDKNINLTQKEFELLVYLTNNEGIALSREQILDSVWGFDYFGDPRSVDTYIKKLREKLGNAGEAIQTIRGRGYKFEVEK